MTKYIACRVVNPDEYFSNDEWGPRYSGFRRVESINTPTPDFICDDDPKPTGIYDQHGNEYFRIKDKIGFKIK